MYLLADPVVAGQERYTAAEWRPRLASTRSS